MNWKHWVYHYHGIKVVCRQLAWPSLLIYIVLKAQGIYLFVREVERSRKKYSFLLWTEAIQDKRWKVVILGCLIYIVKKSFSAKHTLEMISWDFQACPIFSVWCFQGFSLCFREEARGYCMKLEKCSSLRSFASIPSPSWNKEHSKHLQLTQWKNSFEPDRL